MRLGLSILALISVSLQPLSAQEVGRSFGTLGYPDAMAFSPDSKTLAVGNKVQLFDVATGREQVKALGHGHVRSIAFLPDGRGLALGRWTLSGATVELWDGMPLTEPVVLTRFDDGAAPVALTPDGKLVASGGPDGTIKLVQFANRQQRLAFKGHRQTITALAWSPDGKTLASGGSDATTTLWEIRSEAEPRSTLFHKESVRAVAFTPDGRMVASGSLDGRIMLLEVATAKRRPDLVVPPDKGKGEALYCMAISPDGKFLASGHADRGVRIWDLKDGKLIANLPHEHWLGSLAFSPNGKMLAAGVRELKTVKLWNVSEILKGTK